MPRFSGVAPCGGDSVTLGFRRHPADQGFQQDLDPPEILHPALLRFHLEALDIGQHPGQDGDSRRARQLVGEPFAGESTRQESELAVQPIQESRADLLEDRSKLGELL